MIFKIFVKWMRGTKELKEKLWRSKRSCLLRVSGTPIAISWVRKEYNFEVITGIKQKVIKTYMGIIAKEIKNSRKYE